jgi:hypothetical protein
METLPHHRIRGGRLGRGGRAPVGGGDRRGGGEEGDDGGRAKGWGADAASGDGLTPAVVAALYVEVRVGGLGGGGGQ